MKKVLCKDKDGYKLYLTQAIYNNDRIYLGLVWYNENEQEYEIWGDLTINLPNAMIEDDNIIFIDSFITDNILEQLEDIGLLTYLDTIQYNMGRYKKYYLNKKVMEEYIKW
jgi:hypothetical protein